MPPESLDLNLVLVLVQEPNQALKDVGKTTEFPALHIVLSYLLLVSLESLSQHGWPPLLAPRISVQELSCKLLGDWSALAMLLRSGGVSTSHYH